jgi:hypothetical protein
MEYARHDARMRQPADKEGKVSTRRALEATAARGVASAIKLLEGPPFPDSLDYLFDWHLEPHEAEAIHALDVVTRFPDAGEA